MRSFQTDDTNDLFISGRTLPVVSGLDAVLMVAKHAAQAILGEMVLAKDQGMPYFESVWIGNPIAAPFEAAFRARIARIDGVTEIASLETEQVGDVMQYRAEIVTTYGRGVLNG